MENYSLLMGAAAVMKMAVEMAAVSMEEPSGALPRSGRCRNRDSVPGSWLRDGGGNFSRIVASSVRVFDAGYPHGVTLGSVVGSSVTGGTAGCYGYWMHTAPDGRSGYLVPGWLVAQ
ncbi:hypothetical protein QYE76_015391 [Lolium multiflorum]|uniref:Uncharacterized protein n=1 Tax=Lolium multiflorum TaxID=4521 RepID=A0AAD8U6H4_LOLMU|nr:hypothetical protein QYE76_015391 [Lolium multiflorum]